MSNIKLRRGPLLALLSAALFGVSTPLVKLIIGDMSPVLLAGLLYLGSGLGLQLLLVLQRKNSFHELQKLSISQRLKLLGAVVSGGILAPLCLVYGIKLATAFEVSLLLNLETVATTFIAWLAFREHVGSHVWIGKILILIGAAILILHPAASISFSIPGLLIIGACIFWGVDNNLTRDIDELSPVVLASVKGLGAGTVNLLLAVFLSQEGAELNQVMGSLSIGAISYGASLVLFILALREIGSSRTSTYFASGPFFGIILSVFLLGERPHITEWISGAIMLGGLWALYREKHEHLHVHEALVHSHRHIHDEHHQHSHQGEEGPEPHEHVHTHEPIEHSHAHLPDIHHRHGH